MRRKPSSPAAEKAILQTWLEVRQPGAAIFPACRREAVVSPVMWYT